MNAVENYLKLFYRNITNYINTKEKFELFH